MFARVIVFYIVKIIVVRFILANGISVNVHNNDLSHYKGPTTCVDPETGIKYSIEAEWVSQNAGNCYKMQCKRVTLFTIVNIIRCEDHFKTANPNIECKKKKGNWPKCCAQCKGH